MGRQVCFFATSKDVDLLIEKIHKLDAEIINDFGSVQSLSEIYSTINNNNTNTSRHKFFVAKREFLLCDYERGAEKLLDQRKSEIIELSLCAPSPCEIVDTSLVDSKYTKNGFLIIDNADEYSKKMEELMKSPTYRPNPNYVKNGYDYGRLWYSSSFIDKEGINIKKAKNLDTLYNALQHFIKTKFRLTKDGFAYIGPDAHKQYIKGIFIPCSGSYRIQVD